VPFIVALTQVTSLSLRHVNMLKSEKGISLIETIVAVAILGIISAAFLGALATTSSARAENDERTSSKILAESIMENIKTENYTASYTPAIPPEFEGYTATVDTTNERNGNIQKIVITITHHRHEVLTLESYKVNRTQEE
jgi:prepilin-type N-terminal cleavage/methylation domain-containing protein